MAVVALLSFTACDMRIGGKGSKSSTASVAAAPPSSPAPPPMTAPPKVESSAPVVPDAPLPVLPPEVPEAELPSCLSLKACTEGCDKKEGKSCERLASFYASGWGIPKDLERARALVNQACELGYAIGCPIERDPDDPKSVDRAARRVALLEGGCNAGRNDHCGLLGYTLLSPLLKNDVELLSEAESTIGKRAIGLLEKACEGGDYNSCNLRYNSKAKKLSAHAGDMAYEDRIFAKLTSSRLQACNSGGDGWACDELGRVEKEAAIGKNQGPSFRKSGEIFAKDILAGWPEDCTNASLHTEHDQDLKAKVRAQCCRIGGDTFICSTAEREAAQSAGEAPP